MRHVVQAVCPALLAACSLLPGLVTGCAATQREGLPAGIERPEACAVILLVDGLDRARMDEQASRGRLPNIRRYFIDEGVGVRHAIAALPPITYASVASLLTGCLPARHGIYGNRWFDRHTLELRDYGELRTFRSVNGDLACPTVYEHLGNAFTVNVQCHTRRGVSESIDHSLANGLAWALGRYEAVDRRVGASVPTVLRKARQRGGWPLVTMFYFPGLDEIGHRCGPDSDRYYKAMDNIDEQVGRIVRSIESLQPADRVYFVLMSDHGHVATPPTKHVNLTGWLRRHREQRITERPPGGNSRRVRARRLERFDAVLVRGADRSAVIHLRAPHGWSQPPTPAQVEAFVRGPRPASVPLWEAPGVDLVCYQSGPDRVRVESRVGRVTVEVRRANGKKLYRLDPAEGIARASGLPPDPLGYLSDSELAAFVAAGWHDSRTWLQATATTRHPDFVPQIAEYFGSTRAGNVVLFAADGYAFGRQAGNHGSALASDMRIVLYFRGPDLKRRASIPAASIVDVVPTLLDLIDRTPDERTCDRFDGISLASQLRLPTSTGVAR